MSIRLRQFIQFDMINIWHILLIAVILISLGGCTGSSNDTPVTSTGTIDKDVLTKIKRSFSAMSNSGVLNGTVLLAQNGHILLNQGYGYVDQQQSQPDAATTKYGIGTLTQQFTAAAILVLQQQGKLNEQDSICKYLTECSANWQPVTIQNLLAHTSGLADYLRQPRFDDVKYKQTTSDQLINLVKNLPLAFTPGKATSNSNTDYLLLGVIIEKITGQPYETFVQQNILNQVNLSSTGFLDGNGTPDLAKGSVSRPFDISVEYATASMYSTTSDLYQWTQALVNHKALTKDIDATLLKPRLDICGANARCNGVIAGLSMAYGNWGVGKRSQGANKEVLFDGGGAVGYVGQIIYYQKEKITMIYLSNSNSIGAYSTNLIDVIEKNVFPDKSSPS